MADNVIVRLKEVAKTFGAAPNLVYALRDVNVEVYRSEYLSPVRARCSTWSAASTALPLGRLKSAG